MNTTDKKAVIVFAKFPAEGKVKTRLALGEGSETALFFYNECCKYIFGMLDNFSTEKTDIFLFYSADDEEDKVRRWVGKAFNFVRQSRGDLGDKMRNAFALLFDKGYEKVLIIGTDIPDLNENNLNDAFGRLSGYEIVIGPADDGGYFLLGMTRRSDELFSGIPWSSEKTLDLSIKAIREAGKSFSLLGMLRDVDDSESLKEWISQPGGNEELKGKMKRREG